MKYPRSKLWPEKDVVIMPGEAKRGGKKLEMRQYMVIERFKNKDPVPAYRRFQERGRMVPDGLVYVSSWIDEDIERCYLIMETQDRSLLDQWIAKWSDLVDFEVHPVLSTQEVLEKITPRL